MIIETCRGSSVTVFDYLNFDRLEDLIIALKKSGVNSVGLESLSSYDTKFTYKTISVDDLDLDHLKWINAEVDNESRYLRLWNNPIN